MRVIADLHIHSRFARAVSSQMTVPIISEWAKKKGIDIVATGDWTHPIWFRELQVNLIEAGAGVYKAKNEPEDGPLFLLSTELSSIYSQGGETRRIHTLFFVPSFETIGKINKELTVRGGNLMSDGRPILGMSAKEITEMVLAIDDKCLVIPAHAWTPWYSLYGSKSGFDSIEECFGALSPSIYAIETGLSSDPAMNWRIEELTSRRIVSFSDAHSPAKIGREATVFQVKKSKIKDQNDKSKIKISYKDVYDAITGSPEGDWEIGYTIEFYPEEGKYHFTGHRNCKVVYSPKETRKMGTTCPVCGKSLTVGVMSRVESLASQDIEIETEKDEQGVQWIRDKNGKRTPYVMLVPLLEILSEALSAGAGSQKVLTAYEQLINTVGPEFDILLRASLEDIERMAGERVAEGIKKVRAGDIMIEPGYDGVFGEVKIWKREEAPGVEEQLDQATLF